MKSGYSLHQYSVGHKVAKRGAGQDLSGYETFCQSTIGGLSRSHRVQRVASTVADLESRFMRSALVASRSESQRNSRRAAR